MTPTFAVYTLTPRGKFSRQHEGADLTEALKEYNKLVESNKARLLHKYEGWASEALMHSEHFEGLKGV